MNLLKALVTCTTGHITNHAIKEKIITNMITKITDFANFKIMSILALDQKT